MATIRHLSNKTWQAIIRRKVYPKQYKTFPSKLEALQWAREVETDVDKGTLINYKLASQTTLNDIIDRYQNECQLINRSYKRENSRLSLLRKYLGEFSIDRLTPSRIALFRDLRLSHGLSPGTVVKDLNTLSKLLKIAQREWGLYLATNPILLIQKPKVVGHRVRRLTKIEEEILLKNSSAEMSNLILFAIETGMRLGEILSLTWNDIQNNMAVLQHTKNGEIRYVPFTQSVQEMLKRIVKNENDPRIFYQWKTVSGFESSWQRFKNRENLINLRFHDLRHEAISRMFEKGLNHMEVSSISGHKSLLILRKYTHYNFKYLFFK